MRLVLGGVLARVRAGPLRSANKLKTLGSLLKFNNNNLTGPMLHYHTLRS